MANWLASFPVQIQIGLISALITLLGILLKDFILRGWVEYRANRRLAIEVYRNYADPIAAAASSLFWRLREILVEEGRGAFLKTSGSETPFDKYKYESTLYRISALIAWLRAYRRELTFFSLSDSDKLRELKDAILAFEAALADGAHIESRRVRSVAALWELTVPESKIFSIGVAVEQVLKTFLHSNTAATANDLTQDVQFRLCKTVSDTLTQRISIAPLPEKIVRETSQSAIRSLSIREAWLYRDFQSGIGDLMIRITEGGARRFDVAGFKDFEALLLSEDDNDKRWVERLMRIVNGLDISGADQYDARVSLLEETFLATIRLLAVLAQIDPDRGSVAKKVLSEGDRLSQDQAWRKSAGA